MIRYLIFLGLFCIGAFLGFWIGNRMIPEPNVPALKISAEAKPVVDQQLKNLLRTIPGIQGVRLGIVHGGGPVKRTTVDRFRFDVLGAESNPGFNVGGTANNLPLSQWDDYLPILVANRCPVIRVKDMAEDSPRVRILAYGVTVFMGCPLKAPDGSLQGAIFALWGTEPTGETPTIAEEKLRIAAKNIQVQLSQ